MTRTTKIMIVGAGVLALLMGTTAGGATGSNQCGPGFFRMPDGSIIPKADLETEYVYWPASANNADGPGYYRFDQFQDPFTLMNKAKDNGDLAARDQLMTYLRGDMVNVTNPGALSRSYYDSGKTLGTTSKIGPYDIKPC